MTHSSDSTQSEISAPVEAAGSPCILSVCTSCRPSGIPREPREDRPGYILYEELRAAIDKSSLRSRVEVQPAECLSICPRPCGFALSSPGFWSYLFGDQLPAMTTAEILECISLYLNSPNGFMPRKLRPKSLRGSILGRIPPPGENNKCI